MGRTRRAGLIACGRTTVQVGRSGDGACTLLAALTSAPFATKCSIAAGWLFFAASSSGVNPCAPAVVGCGQVGAGRCKEAACRAEECYGVRVRVAGMAMLGGGNGGCVVRERCGDRAIR